MLALVGAVDPGGGIRCCPACRMQPGDRLTPIPSLPPFNSLPVPSPIMAKPNRKLEGKGIFYPETPAFPGKTESGYEGQQEFSAVRRGEGEILNNLISRDPHRTKHQPVRVAAIICPPKSYAAVH